MDKSDAETIKQKLEECLELVTVEDGFTYLTLRMAMIHNEAYLEKQEHEIE